MTRFLDVARIAALAGMGISSAQLQAQTRADVPATQSPGASNRQTAAQMSFDVASVKPGKPGAPGSEQTENGRYAANGTLFSFIEFAWDLMPGKEQMDVMLARAPAWVSTARFEVQAVAQRNPTKDQMRLMVRSLLADRFRLQVHTLSEETAVLALIPDKPGVTGPKLRPHSEGQPCGVHPASSTRAVGEYPPVCEQFLATAAPHGGIMIAARDMTMHQIATFVSSLGVLTRPVVDGTGLSGRFDFTIEFTPERRGPPQPQDAQSDDLQATTLQEALHEQLGLKLRATKAIIETLIVDHAERPSEN